jgi:hypothetical protein
MGRWSRDELEQAFANYRAVVADCGRSGDWGPLADIFTEDATLEMSIGGKVGGREAYRRFMVEKMSGPPGMFMPHYPCEWYMVDEDQGRIVAQMSARFADPGDGSVFQGPYFLILKYAGDNLWSSEDDTYSPLQFADLLAAWEARRAELAQDTVSG